MDSQTRKTLGALASSADGVFAVDGSYRITHWSKSAQELLGYASHDVLGKPCYEVIHGSDPQGLTWCQQDCAVVQRLRDGKAVSHYDILTTRKNGASVWLNISIVPVSQGRGLPAIPVHLFREVTLPKTKEFLAERVMDLVGEVGRTAAQQENQGHLEDRRRILARREWAVLSLLAEGHSTRNVARKLGIREVTVRNYVQRIFSKLGVHSRSEAIAWLYRRRQGGSPRASLGALLSLADSTNGGQ